MFCTNCGTKLQDNAAFCTKCGTRVVPNQTSVQQAPPQQAYSAPQANPQPQYAPPQQAYSVPQANPQPQYAPPQQAVPQQGSSPFAAVSSKLSSIDVSKLTETVGNSKYLGIVGIVSAVVVCVTMFLRWVSIPCGEIASTFNGLLGDYGVFLPNIPDFEFSLLSISDSLHNVDGVMGLLSLMDSYDYQVAQAISSISAYKTLVDVFIILGILSLILVIVGVAVGRFEGKGNKIALIGFVACLAFSLIAIITIGRVNATISSYILESEVGEGLSYYMGPDALEQLKSLHFVKGTIAPTLCAVFSAVGAAASFLTIRKAR